ncbi:hypothetical protein PRZ48_006108 [Zasmidium cellare]|uniref:Uncharacterized protein n=1 Tax=Zasmidium cellare TaxID=395010 RepID=A0ABR0EM67_ZASCE|nr:hypothetical protein PRZ48_006108 [Zasmidium cellare]
MSLKIQGNGIPQPVQDAPTHDGTEDTDRIADKLIHATEEIAIFWASISCLTSLNIGIHIGLHLRDVASTFGLLVVAALIDFLYSSAHRMQSWLAGHAPVRDRKKMAMRFVPYICCILAILTDPGLGITFVVVVFCDVATRAFVSPRMPADGASLWDETRKCIVETLPYLTSTAMVLLAVANFMSGAKIDVRKLAV